MNFDNMFQWIIGIPLTLLLLIVIIVAICVYSSLFISFLKEDKEDSYFEKYIKEREPMNTESVLINDDTRRLDFISRESVEIQTESEEVGKPGEKIRVSMFRLNCNGTAGSPHFDVRRAIDEMMEIESEKYLASL